jgi:hypothetical protein
MVGDLKRISLAVGSLLLLMFHLFNSRQSDTGFPKSSLAKGDMPV